MIFNSTIHIKILLASLISPTHATCPPHLILLDTIIMILVKGTNDEAQHYAISLQPPVTSYLGSKYFILTTLFFDVTI